MRVPQFLKCLFGFHNWTTPRYRLCEYNKGNRETIYFTGFLSICRRNACRAERFRSAREKFRGTRRVVNG